jgi:hypothetical protein
MTGPELFAELDRLISDAKPEEKSGLALALLARLGALAAGMVAAPAVPPSGSGQAEDRLLDMREVAERLGIPEDRARDLGRRGELLVVTIGKYKRVRLSALAAYVAAHEKQPLTRVPYATYSGHGEGRRGSAAPAAPRADAGPARRAAGRRAKQRGALGAGRDGHAGDGRAAVAGAGAAGAEG